MPVPRLQAMIYKTPLLFFFGLSLHLGAAECNVMRTVPIRLFNDAAVTPRVVIAAQSEATWILRSLCVEIEWVQSPSPKALEIFIIAAPLRQSTTPFALGMTILNTEYGSRATVFLSRVSSGVREASRSYLSTIRLHVLLGCVLAHEIGHMLLNTNAHAPAGVMIAAFGEPELLRAEQRRLIFTPSDREIFLRQIARRISVNETVLPIGAELSAK